MKDRTFATNYKSITRCNYKYYKSNQITKSHIPATKTPTQVIVSTKQSSVKVANELSFTSQKHGSKENKPRKRRMKY